MAKNADFVQLIHPHAGFNVIVQHSCAPNCLSIPKPITDRKSTLENAKNTGQVHQTPLETGADKSRTDFSRCAAVTSAPNPQTSHGVTETPDGPIAIQCGAIRRQNDLGCLTLILYCVHHCVHHERR